MGEMNYSPALKAKLEKANEMLAAEAENYTRMLQADLVELAVVLSDRDYERVAVVAYNIESRAGTFGWPLVTGAAGLMRDLMEEGRATSPTMAIIRDSMALMVRDNMKDMAIEGRVLLETLRAAVTSEIGIRNTGK
ncbi:hypothetical protein [Emcibacter sp.]|uniref:hypothetical protein n=1 Tax=Emcibacter sp. TaxID=1979954 RepID=UPI003A8C89D0